jgi:HEPN domain-containing protein
MNEINVILEGKEYQIDIQKAKELGVIKEKDQRCKSWKEYCNKYLHKEGFYYDDVNENILSVDYPCAANEQLTKEEAVAISAFSKLLKLRRDWIGDWNPNWNIYKIKYCITYLSDHLCISYWESYHHPFSFPTEEMAEEFLKCFKDLFEQCKNLI